MMDRRHSVSWGSNNTPSYPTEKISGKMHESIFREKNGARNPMPIDSRHIRSTSPPVCEIGNSQSIDCPKSPGIRHRVYHNESDVAAGLKPAASSSLEIGDGSANSSPHQISSNRVRVLGIDISHFSPTVQFILCAGGVFGFNLVYGFLQELLSVQILNRQIGLFLAFSQFSGYTIWSFLLRTFVHKRGITKAKNSHMIPTSSVPFKFYIGISLLRAFDLGMTNMAMQYINYPAKTLLKSSKTLWTMLFGLIVVKKTYKRSDYATVVLMVAGLATFLHADATSSAVFEPLGVIMLVSIFQSLLYP